MRENVFLKIGCSNTSDHILLGPCQTTEVVESIFPPFLTGDSLDEQNGVTVTTWFWKLGHKSRIVLSGFSQEICLGAVGAYKKMGLGFRTQVHFFKNNAFILSLLGKFSYIIIIIRYFH